MRLFAALVFAAVAPSAAQPASQPGVAALFNDFGLFGHWAVDCKRAASPDNPHVTVSEPEPGRVLEQHDLGPGYRANAYRMLNAHRVSATRIAVEALFEPGGAGEQRQDLVFSVRDHTRRTLFTKVEGGPVRVKEGHVAGHTLETPRLRKCG